MTSQEAFSQHSDLLVGLSEVVGAMIGVLTDQQKKALYPVLSGIWTSIPETDRQTGRGYMIGRFLDLLTEYRPANH